MGCKNGVFARKFMECGKSWSLTDARLVMIFRSFETFEHFNSNILKMTIMSTLSGMRFIKNVVRIAKHNGV